MFGISYWILPLVAGCVWLGTLLGMIGTWAAQGSPHYYWMGANQRIAYISDIGASGLQPLFIAGSAVMVVVFDIAFIEERWLRHTGRLAHNTSTVEKVLSIISVVAAIIGAAGLILLTIFDVRQYPTIHDSMLGVFIGGYIISAVFIDAEYQRLGISYRDQRILRISFWLKLAFIFVEIILVVAFGVTSYKDKYNVAAVLEWTISLIYIFYVWSFILDFLPAVHTNHHRFPPVRHLPGALEEQGMNDSNTMGGPVHTSRGEDEYSHGNYGSQQPMRQTGRQYPAPGPVAPSTKL